MASDRRTADSAGAGAAAAWPPAITRQMRSHRIGALVFHGPTSVTVDEVPDARVEEPTDVLVKITTTNICGSDLHLHEGRANVEEGKILGHENLSIAKLQGGFKG